MARIGCQKRRRKSLGRTKSCAVWDGEKMNAARKMRKVRVMFARKTAARKSVVLDRTCRRWHGFNMR